MNTMEREVLKVGDRVTIRYRSGGIHLLQGTIDSLTPNKQFAHVRLRKRSSVVNTILPRVNVTTILRGWHKGERPGKLWPKEAVMGQRPTTCYLVAKKRQDGRVPAPDQSVVFFDLDDAKSSRDISGKDYGVFEGVLVVKGEVKSKNIQNVLS